MQKIQCLFDQELAKRFDLDYIQPGYITQAELDDLTKVYYDSLYDC